MKIAAKFILLLIAAFLTFAAALPVLASDKEPTPEEEAKAFEEFKQVLAQCRAAGGCIIVTRRAADRDLNAAFQIGVEHGKKDCRGSV